MNIKRFIKNVIKLLRYEFNSFRSVKIFRGESIIFSDKAMKLNVGGGKNHEKTDDWVIVDVRNSTADICMDISVEPLPYDDNQVDLIFTSHTLEHIYPQRLKYVLDEFYRVLKPGACLRIVVPDISKAIKAYVDADYSFFARSEVSPRFADAPLGGQLASWFYSQRLDSEVVSGKGEGHVHCFDYEYMEWWLLKTGFKKVWQSSFRSSIVEELRGENFDRYEHESIFIECIK